MIKKLKITILVDDQPDRQELIAEHGLALWIEADDRRILFDTGWSDALVHNAKVLGIDLADADAIVLSHGHYDHTGGLAAVLDINKTADIYCHPGVVVPRYSRCPDGSFKPIAMPSASSAALKQSARVHRSSCPGLLGDSIGVTGFVPRETSFENTGGAFFLDPEATWADPISDDQSMWIQTEKGLVIVAGCCHAGIVNTIDFIQQVVSDKNVFALIGGLHLHNASQDRIHQTCDLFSSVGIQAIMPCHCTGEEAVSAIRAIQAVSFLPGYSGSRFETV